jgi:hypothetical protein
VVEIAKAPLEGITYRTGRQISGEEITVAHTNRRLRLGAKSSGEDHWFKFPTTWLFSFRDPYKAVARSVLPWLERQAEPWWAEEKNICRYT